MHFNALALSHASDTLDFAANIHKEPVALTLLF